MGNLPQGRGAFRLSGILLAGFLLLQFSQIPISAQSSPASPFVAQRVGTFNSNFSFNKSIYDRLHTLSESIGYGRGDRFVNSAPLIFPSLLDHFNADEYESPLILGQNRNWPERIRRFNTREKSGFFFQGNASRLHQENDFGIGEFETDSYGFSLGADMIYSRNLILGAAFDGYSDDTWTPSRKADSDSYTGSVYGIWCANDWSFGGVLGVAYNKYGARFRENAAIEPSSEHHANLYFVSGEISRKMRLVNFDMSPFYFLHYQRLEESSYRESGRDFTVDSAGTDSLRQLLGVRFGRRIPLGSSLVLDPQFEAAWVHDYTDNTMSASGFDGGLAYIRTEKAPGRDRGYVSLSLDCRINPHWIAFCRLGADIGRRYTNQGVQVGFSLAF